MLMNLDPNLQSSASDRNETRGLWCYHGDEWVTDSSPATSVGPTFGVESCPSQTCILLWLQTFGVTSLSKPNLHTFGVASSSKPNLHLRWGWDSKSSRFKIVSHVNLIYAKIWKLSWRWCYGACLDDGAAFSKLMSSLGDSNMKAQGEGVSPKFQTQIG